MDAAHATRLGVEVAKRLGDALVAPTIRVGCSDHHIKFPGTVTLRRPTFEAVCEDYCISLAQHGFTSICFYSCHGGNFRVLKELEPRLNSLVGPDCRVIAFSDLKLLVDTWREVADEWGGLGDRVGGHADIAEASITLAIHPELVHVGAAEPGYLGDIFDQQVLDTLLDEGFDKLTPNGIIGDPRGMDAELGERCIQAESKMLERYFRARISESENI